MTVAERVAALVESWTGINLARGAGAGSLERFLSARVEELGLPSQEVYLERLVGPEDASESEVPYAHHQPETAL